MEFFSLILLVVAGFIGYKVYRANFGGGVGENSLTDRRSGQPAVSNDPRIENMRPGGVFRLRGVGPNMDDFDVSVVGRHVYDEDGFQWLEIEGDAGTQRLWVTVEDDDEVEVSVTLRKARLEEIGLTKGQMEALTDNDDHTLQVEGTTYHFEDRGQAVFHRDGDLSRGESFTYWEFESDDEKTSMTVERWSDGTFECHFSQSIRESQISIYSVAGDS